MDKKDFKSLILLFLASFLIFYPVLNTYFSGDDFFHFKVSQTDGSLMGFIKLFGFYPFEERGIAFYRPLFREGLFNISYSLFGLNHLPFRILQFILHFVNTALVYVFIKKLFNNITVARFATLFFAISAAHIGSLYYLAGGVHSQAVLMFTLSCLLAFWNNRKRLSFVAFVLALMTDELALAIPALIVGIMWLKNTDKNWLNKKFFLDVVKNIWVHTLVVGVFLYMVVFVIGTSQSEVEYKINLNPKTFANTLSWYVAWSIGIPEMLVDFLGSGLKLNPDLMKNWGNYFKVIFISAGTFTAFLGLAILQNFKRWKLFKDKKFWFLVMWFIVGIMPVLFWPIHKKTVYLQVSLPAICTLFAYLLVNYKKPVLILGSLAFVALNITTIKLAENTYWAKQRGDVAQKLITDFKGQYPTLPQNAVVIVKNDPEYPFISKEWGGTSTQAYFVWNGSDALQLLYKDSGIRVEYEDKIDPETSFINPTYDFIAKIN